MNLLFYYIICNSGVSRILTLNIQKLHSLVKLVFHLSPRSLPAVCVAGPKDTKKRSKNEKVKKQWNLCNLWFVLGTWWQKFL